MSITIHIDERRDEADEPYYVATRDADYTRGRLRPGAPHGVGSTQWEAIAALVNQVLTDEFQAVQL